MFVVYLSKTEASCFQSWVFTGPSREDQGQKKYVSLFLTTGQSTGKPLHAGDRSKAAAHNIIGYAI